MKILVAEDEAVAERTSPILPRSLTERPNAFFVFVAISAAVARSRALAPASFNVGSSALVACAALRPFLVRFSNALAASVAEYLVVAPSLWASFCIILNCLSVAFDTAWTLAIASWKSFPTLTIWRPNAVMDPRANAPLTHFPKPWICL